MLARCRGRLILAATVGRQLVPLIKAAVAYRGTALLDIISPCEDFATRGRLPARMG